MRMDELELHKTYFFKRNGIHADFVGTVTKLEKDNIHITPCYFVSGYGDVNDVREFNKAAYDNFYEALREAPKNKEEAPEFFL